MSPISKSALYDKKLDVLTGLRFFAALCILWGHSAAGIVQFSGPRILDFKPYIAFFATWGMTLFFVLSGVVIHYNYAQMLAGLKWRSMARFLMIRLARLYPAYLFLTVVHVANVGVLQESWSTIFRYLLLMQSWFYTFDKPTHKLLAMSIYGISWSISTELMLYILYIFLSPTLAFFRTPKQAAIGLIGFIIFSLVILTLCAYHLDDINAFAASVLRHYVSPTQDYPNSFQYWLFYYSPYSRIFEFITGCFIASLYMALRDKPISSTEKISGKIILGLSLALLVFLIAGNLPQIKEWLFPVISFGYSNYTYAPPLAAIIFCCCRYGGAFAGFVSRPWFIFLGERSYSMYLSHIIIYQLFFEGVNSWTDERIIFAVIRWACCIICAIIFSLGCYSVIEVPSRTYLRKRINILFG